MPSSDRNAGLSRREMGSVGTGLLATPLLASVGRTAEAAGRGGAALGSGEEREATGHDLGGRQMQNPLTEYPKPPFKKQHQEPPGLASKMDPRPDHGETSYKGSGKLRG